ncbi:hypothetical protein Glove_99g154 [Diversispora epigaea]|uniref:SWIRM domain-containing protein n=1 Tax=Diversispora epigaea TaxID=1348612 RepID=A0A397JD23_9GLOM|nr:hypothetical protein Glove_99g154 [Diversispora epigaea]
MTYGKDKMSQVFYKSHHSSSKKAIDKLLSKSLAKSLKKRREQKKLKKLHLAKTKHKYHDRINESHNNAEICEKSDSSDSNMTIDYVSDDSDIYPRSKNLSISKTDFGSDQSINRSIDQNMDQNINDEYTPKKKNQNVKKNSAPKNVNRPFTMDIMNLLLVTDDDVSRSNSTSTISSPTSTPPSTPGLLSDNNNNNNNNNKSQKLALKSKGNSFARVMIDRGISDQSTIPQELNPIRIPSTPHLEWEDLIKNINDMNLNTGNLDNITLNIKWKSNPLEISHLQRFEFLHKIEAEVASLLRLTPVQYLTSKNTLLSASRRYKERMLPFRKSDAQKMLKMDVNKASKLWEFFRQAQWL